jgi:hypothetical protein
MTGPSPAPKGKAVFEAWLRGVALAERVEATVARLNTPPAPPAAEPDFEVVLETEPELVLKTCPLCLRAFTLERQGKSKAPFRKPPEAAKRRRPERRPRIGHRHPRRPGGGPVRPRRL